eukprot:919984-Pelagomonas_calceolata.AAC.3
MGTAHTTQRREDEPLPIESASRPCNLQGKPAMHAAIGNAHCVKKQPCMLRTRLASSWASAIARVVRAWRRSAAKKDRGV